MEIADCYRLLGLRAGASYEEIKSSYRRLARIYHPDANPSNQQQANEKFIQLTEAYRKLSSVVSPSNLSSPNLERKETARTKASGPRDRPASTPPRQVRTSAPQGNAQVRTPSVQTSPNLTPTDSQLKQESYEQLQQLLREHRFPRAIALVEGLSQRLPQDLEVRQWQAITYQRFGRYLIGVNQSEKAKPYLRKALRTDPHNQALGYEVDRDFQRIKELAAMRKDKG
jgi:curved DNA-binding protein CbpA